jgi:hypothetical protein
MIFSLYNVVMVLLYDIFHAIMHAFNYVIYDAINFFFHL